MYILPVILYGLKLLAIFIWAEPYKLSFPCKSSISDEINYKKNIWSCAIDICEPFALKIFFAVREYDLNEPTRLLYGLNLLGFYMG
jgi:hypothetical protein